jgi:uncharacterized glyoxalase superfamily protein PhnB
MFLVFGFSYFLFGAWAFIVCRFGSMRTAEKRSTPELKARNQKPRTFVNTMGMLANRSIPQSTVLPELAYPDIGVAIEWLSAAFGFTLRLRIADHRAQMNVGNGAVILTELGELPVTGALLGHSVMVRVEDVNQHFDRALEHGARVLHPLADYPYGERQYSVEDLIGRRWTFSQSITDVDPRDWGGTPGQL